MQRLINEQGPVEDRWTLVPATDEPESVELAGDLIVPLNVWQARSEELRARGTGLGVWLDSTEEPETIAEDLGDLDLVAINFPVFRDGRGFSSARILRDRYGFRGELRAIGDVLRDQLFYMKRCGFDTFALREDQDPEAAVAAFRDFAHTYQAASDQPDPLFRRRVNGD